MDDDSIREAITAACKHGCKIGAHPSYPDRQGFGRQRIQIDRLSLGNSIKHQLGTFSRIALECKASVEYIKAHGALYHEVAKDTSLAHWYWDICSSIFPHARFVGPIGASVLDYFRAAGIPVLSEGFCDRVYELDGTLRNRNDPGACISDPELAASQAERLVRDFGCDLLCVHSDTINSIEIAKAVNFRLADQEFWRPAQTNRADREGCSGS
ncbi:MAG: LamB/YcsF family protein [Phycisphaerales bacterium]